MRSILISMLLLVTVITLYLTVASGEGGTKAGLTSYGKAMADSIRNTSP
ncbi:hypothetical protein [Paenibacillus beijingensis]|nr:hypothetical protein [Paenibacillus beijingensis]